MSNTAENHLQRPPYSGEGAESPKYGGTCFCKTVHFTISRDAPLDSKFCHCKTCQKLHGAPFQWAAIFQKTDVCFTRGTTELVFWNAEEESGEYSLPCKVSCGRCRTPIMDEGRQMLMLFPSLINFRTSEDRKKFYPSCHIFYGQRVMDVKDGKPKFAGHKEEGETIPETSE